MGVMEGPEGDPELWLKAVLASALSDMEDAEKLATGEVLGLVTDAVLKVSEAMGKLDPL